MANISLKLRLYTLVVALFGVFGLVGAGQAYGLFPNNTKSIYLDVHSGTSGQLLAGTSTVRTVLYASADYNGTDAHVCINATSTCSANPSISKLIDDEGGIGHTDNFAPRTIPANQPLGWHKAVGSERLSITVSYVDYDISLIPEDTASSSTVQDVNIVGGNVVINASSTIATSSYAFNIATTTLKDATSTTFGTILSFIGNIFGAWWPFIIMIGFCVAMATYFYKKSNSIL